MGFFSGIFNAIGSVVSSAGEFLSNESTYCCAKCEHCSIISPDGVHRCYICNNGGYYKKYSCGYPVLGYKQRDIIEAPPCGGDTRIYKHWNSNGQDDGSFNPALEGCYDFEEPTE